MSSELLVSVTGEPGVSCTSSPPERLPREAQGSADTCLLPQLGHGHLSHRVKGMTPKHGVPSVLRKLRCCSDWGLLSGRFLSHRPGACCAVLGTCGSSLRWEGRLSPFQRGGCRRRVLEAPSISWMGWGRAEGTAGGAEGRPHSKL